MDNWNFDMSDAPRGTVQVDEIEGPKGQPIKRERHVPERIIACGADGKTVTVSRWLPEAERWEFFSKKSPPIGWQPWPAHPSAMETQDETC